MPRKLLLGLAMVILAAGGMAAGYYLNQFTQDSQPESASASDAGPVGKARPEFALPNLDGEPQSIGKWDGDVVMINFWATWCPPCRREIPAFIELQEKYGDRGFTIVGVAIDTEQNVRDFLDPMGINYPVVIGEEQAIAVAKEYGNRMGVLPYTVIVDRQGRIAYSHRSELHFEQAAEMIEPLLGSRQAQVVN